MTSDHPLIIVTGLPRCGASLVMAVLEGGGVQPFGTFPSYDQPSSEGIEGGIIRSSEVELVPRALKWLDLQEWIWPVVDDELAANTRFVIVRRNLRHQAESYLKTLRAHRPEKYRKVHWPTYRRRASKRIGAMLRRNLIKLRKELQGLDVAEVRFEEFLTNPARAVRQLSIAIDVELEVGPAAHMVHPRTTGCLDGLLVVREAAEGVRAYDVAEVPT